MTMMMMMAIIMMIFASVPPFVCRYLGFFFLPFHGRMGSFSCPRLPNGGSTSRGSGGLGLDVVVCEGPSRSAAHAMQPNRDGCRSRFPIYGGAIDLIWKATVREHRKLN